ncbi:MAG: DNA polymerase III subunit [Clostridia bacterium]|nr:DNA polymerase III subunit [Clostridia bacterium]
MKPFFTDIAGCEPLKNRIGSLILAGQFGHAYILSGAPGSGRHLFANRIAAALCCENLPAAGRGEGPLPCMRCPSCRRILEGDSPDVQILTKEKDKATFGINVIRDRIVSHIAFPPTEMPYRVFILEDADLMTPEAQNAFLLTLEEPPAYAVFFLLVQDTSALLETIRSRSLLFRIPPLDRNELRDYLETNSAPARRLRESDPPGFDALVLESRGSIGRAKELLGAQAFQSLMALRQTTLELCRRMTENNPQASISILSSFKLKDSSAVRPQLTRQWQSFQIALRDLLCIKKAERCPLNFFLEEESAQELAESLSASRILRAYEATDRAIRHILRNGNPRITLYNWASEIGLL